MNVSVYPKMLDRRTQLFSSDSDNHSVFNQTEKYFAKRNLLVIQFLSHHSLHSTVASQKIASQTKK